MNVPRTLILASIFVIFAAGFSAASDIYIAQNATGGNSGADCADAHSASWFNTSGSWGNGGGQISPGTTVHLCRIITSELYAQGGGAAGNPVTILFESGAKVQVSPGCDANGCLNLGGSSNLVIDGGLNQPCGWNTATNSSEGSCNGQIENMLYGSRGATCPGGACTTQASSSIGCLIRGTGSNLEIRNLEVGPSYIHLASANDPNGTGGICLSNGSNWNIHDSKLHDGGWHTTLTYSGSGTFTNWAITNNELFNNGHMMAIAGANNATANGVTVTGNYCHDMANWDSASDYWHNNCIHTYGSSGTTLTNFILANNIMAGNMGNNVTAQAFIEAQNSIGTNFAIFNNVMSGNPANGRLLLLNVCMSGCYVYNNTFVGTNTTSVTCGYVGGNGGTTTVLGAYENNVMSDCFGLMDSEKSSYGAMDYNVYGIQGSFIWNGSFQASFAAWQAITGGNSHSINSPGGISLGSNFIPQSGSPVKNAAVNVCNANPSFCTSYPAIKNDLAGKARPAGSAAWDAGAYQSASSSGVINPPTGLAAVVQ